MSDDEKSPKGGMNKTGGYNGQAPDTIFDKIEASENGTPPQEPTAQRRPLSPPPPKADGKK